MKNWIIKNMNPFSTRPVIVIARRRAHGYALAEACFTRCADCGPWPGDELSQMRRVTDMVPRDAPDRLLRLAMLFCGGCDMDEQFTLGIDLMIRGLDCGNDDPG